MLLWSKYFQSPDYLELYRKMVMNPEYKELIAKWIRLQNGLQILDVGCGTGVFATYLSDQTQDSTFYGIDIDDNFITCANKKVKELEIQTNNKFNFSIGNALALPFEENSFDLVISYTALTNIPDSKKAMHEMIRVVKPGGWISSVTAQSFTYISQFEGVYPPSHDYFYEYKSIKKMVDTMYESIQPISEYIQYGTEPEKIPSLFAESGLQHIEMHPIGHAFSLSNAIYTPEEKKIIIELSYKAEYDKFLAFMELDEAQHYISVETKKRYLELLQKRRKTLLNDIEENKIWEWIGGAQLLMCGQKPI